MSFTNNYCRFCAEEKSTSELSTLSAQGFSETLDEKLRLIFTKNFVDFSNKTLPEAVCYNCFELIKVCYTFFLRVKKAQVVLKEIFEKEVKFDIKQEFNEECEDDHTFPYEDNNTNIADDLVPETKSNVTTLERTSKRTAQENGTDNYGIDDRPYVYVSAYNENTRFEVDSDTKTGVETEATSSHCERTIERRIQWIEVDAEPLPNHTWAAYPWHCGVCSAPQPSIAALRQHCRAEHHRCAVFKCADCADVFEEFDELVEHARGHRRDLSGTGEGTNPKPRAKPAVIDNLLPPKSREKYKKTYNLFCDWRSRTGENSLSEAVFLNYFNEMASTKQPSTLWSAYSMLKATVRIKHNIDLKKYSKLMLYLKRLSVGTTPKTSKVLAADEIERFLNEAPDHRFLGVKVVLIFGVSGACRSSELLNITVHDIQRHSDSLLVVLNESKSKVDRTFAIRREHAAFVERYQALRPADVISDRFFLQYHNGKCTKQPIGINKIGAIPKEIATYLKLSNPELFTGHCFRRTSAALIEIPDKSLKDDEENADLDMEANE